MARPELDFVVEPGPPRKLGEVLQAVGPGELDALADGRVFVAGERASDAELLVAPETRIQIFAPRSARAVDTDELRVLARQRGFVIVNKPAGMATEPDHSGSASSLVVRIAEQLGCEPSEVHAASRLDVGVSGVVLLGVDADARRQIAELRRTRRIVRRYVAIASGIPQPDQGTWNGAIGRRGSTRLVGGSDAQPAETRYRRVATAAAGTALLALEPLTGRTHQLRVHAAHAGAPFVGDPLYGGPRRLTLESGKVLGFSRVLLHAAWLTLPLFGGVRAEAPLPLELVRCWTSLGGSESDWDRALEDPVTNRP